MKSRQEIRSEETKQAILDAAFQLFTSQGYDAVTMRQIAKAAGCSHTAIYLYFKDKEDLLLRLAMPKLQELTQRVAPQFEAEGEAIPTLYNACWSLIHFSLYTPNLYPLLFTFRPERVDQSGTSDLTAVRNHLFQLVLSFVQRHAPNHPSPLNAARALVFFLNGFILSYAGNTEPPQELIERIEPILLDAITIYWNGIEHAEGKENLS